MRLTADGIYGRVIWVGYNEGELGAGMPTFGRLFGICVVKVDGYGVVGRSVGISEREQEYAPGEK